jgi:hypothetical protein
MEQTILLPTDNALMDTRDPQTKMVVKLVNDIKEIKNNPINSPLVASINLELQNLNFSEFFAPAPQVFLTPELGFATSSFFRNKINPLPAPTQFKGNVINEIQLRTFAVIGPFEALGFMPVVGVTDFTLDFYLSLWLFKADFGNIESQRTTSTLDDSSIRLMCIKYTFNFFASDQLAVTITNPTQSFRLRDSIPYRQIITALPDFTSDPTKITDYQYQRISENDNILANMFGYDINQYNALSAANQNLILTLFGDYSVYDPIVGTGRAILPVFVSAIITYFGINSAYTPANS